jgi:hypothetical protein
VDETTGRPEPTSVYSTAAPLTSTWDAESGAGQRWLAGNQLKWFVLVWYLSGRNDGRGGGYGCPTGMGTLGAPAMGAVGAVTMGTLGAVAMGALGVVAMGAVALAVGVGAVDVGVGGLRPPD